MINPIAATPAAATPTPTPALAPVDIVDGIGVFIAGAAVLVAFETVFDVELGVVLTVDVDDVDRIVVCEPLGTATALVALHSPKSP